ncbi:Oxacillin resistance-related FmtC protein [Romboutsia lituseburensis]|uniref:lysylphosphatidylglycerol synthase domain-containing protein n=1 Tax=Romboutsia lituseburensis TaxID=1537 RepID=UPI000E12CF02|nr:lysylphosphatidylglycerol synthase domain-containing protein [Romboutsia lituseburensis]CEH34910.1 Oxacillin resistance-related FmtC protein [Romboutsia lituseburensis]
MNLGMEDSQSKILDIKNSKNNLNKDKIKSILKIILMIGILIIVLKEFLGIISSFDISKFERYTKELSLLNIICIAFLGIISYIPLSFYDFVLKKRVNIELDNKKLYKFSWIASSVASIAGFGGSTALALKTHFYNDYVKDKKLLIKEISKIIALNLSGFSMVCLVYMMMNTKTIQLNNPKVIGIILISIYLPALIAYLAYKYLTGNLEEKTDAKDAIKIILISASEWLTTIILIYSILVILGIKISIAEFFPIFVISIVVAIVSMSPGGIGSFDLSFMLGLQALGVEGEKILLAIFLYRVSYYLLPLSIGAILYANEIYLKMDNKVRIIATNAVSKVSYLILVGLVFFSGASLLINGLIPNLNDNIKIIRETSYLLMMNRLDSLYFDQIAIILGFGLIATSRLIMYKSKKYII